MAKRLNNALVGLFVIVLGLVWMGITLWLSLGDYTTHYTTYRVYLDESVSGLYQDAPVKYRGVDVGKVIGIELNPAVPDQVQLTLDVVSTTPIREDTLAELAVQGLTGVAFVDLKGGSLESPVLAAKEGQEYPVIRSAPSFFERLDMSGTELMGNLNVLINNLARLLDAEGRQSLRQIIANIDAVTSTLAARKTELGMMVEDGARLMKNSAEASGHIEPLLAQLQETAQSFESMADKVASAGESLNRYVDSSGSGVQQFSRQTLPELGTLIGELRILADSLKGVSEKLEEDPRALIYGRELEVPGPGE
jgi:phospholipid/cholesterol/gamma-HCH transport system substrate-binding protein